MSGPARDRRDRASGRSDRPRRQGWRSDAFLQAGFLVGAAAGAAATVLGHRLEKSARRGLVDWGTAERIAVNRVREAEGTLTPAELAMAEPIYAAAIREVVPALERELGANLPGIVERSGVVSREQWVKANVFTFADLIGRVEGDLMSRVVPPGAGIAKSAMAIANRAVATRQFGFLLGFLGQRVLGQYDLALLSAEAPPGRLLFVDENIRRVADLLDVPLDPFRTWIVLHETTHAFEFEGHPWIRPYIAERLDRQLRTVSSGTSLMSRDALDGLRRAFRGDTSEHWVEGLMGEQQRREFREIQAVMSLLEGFSDFVMDRVGRDLVYDVDRISEKFHARRAQRSGFERAIMRITGLDLKMEQYRQGEAFVSAVAEARGSEGLNALWRGPETVPSLEEIAEPRRWIDRVLPDPAP